MRLKDLTPLMEEEGHPLDHQEQVQEHLQQEPSHHLQDFGPWVED